MPTLTTERLTLRPWRDDDAAFVLDLYSRWEVQRYIGAVPRVMADLDEAEARIRAWRAIEHPVHQVWAVQETAIGALVGTLLVKSIPGPGGAPSGDTEIGWHFHPNIWGRGYATEAASAGLAHAFASGLDRVVAVTNPANLASQAVCARIGMTPLGLSDAYYDQTCALFEATAR